MVIKIETTDSHVFIKLTALYYNESDEIDKIDRWMFENWNMSLSNKPMMLPGESFSVSIPKNSIPNLEEKLVEFKLRWL